MPEVLIDHSRDKIKSIFDPRRARLERFALVLLRDCVFTQTKGDILRMGHGGHPLGVTFVHLLNEAKNLGKTSPIVGNLIVSNF